MKCQHINTIHQKHPRFKNVLTSSSICKMLPLKHPWRNPCQSSHLQTEGGIFQETDALFNCLKRWATTGTPINPSPESCVCLKMWYQYNIYIYMHYIYIPQFLFVIEHVLLWSLVVMFSMKQIVIWIPLRWGWGLCLGHPWWIWCCGTLSQVLSTGTLRFLLKNKLSCQAVTLSIYCFR